MISGGAVVEDAAGVEVMVLVLVWAGIGAASTSGDVGKR